MKTIINNRWLVIKALLILAVLITNFQLPITAMAQEKPGPATQELLHIINRLIGWMAAILLAVTVAFIVYAAYLYLTSQGDVEKVKTANRVILYAVVAVAVALLAYVFIAIITALVGPGQRTPGTTTTDESRFPSNIKQQEERINAEIKAGGAWEPDLGTVDKPGGQPAFDHQTNTSFVRPHQP